MLFCGKHYNHNIGKENQICCHVIAHSKNLYCRQRGQTSRKIRDSPEIKAVVPNPQFCPYCPRKLNIIIRLHALHCCMPDRGENPRGGQGGHVPLPLVKLCFSLGCFLSTLGCFLSTLGCFLPTLGCFFVNFRVFFLSTLGCFLSTLGCFFVNFRVFFVNFRVFFLQL